VKGLNTRSAHVKGYDNLCVCFCFAAGLLILTVLFVLQPVLPELDGLGQVLVGIMESCWAHEPEDRPTFLEIEQRFTSMN